MYKKKQTLKFTRVRNKHTSKTAGIVLAHTHLAIARHMARHVTYVLRKIILLKLTPRIQSETFTLTITVTL